MLENCMFPSADMLIDQNKWWQLQQDMTPPHTACIVKAWVEDKEVNLMQT